jgi:hypothetical protein
LDTSSIRGERNVGVALANAQAKALLTGFEFNKNALLSSILYKPWAINSTTGEITIADFVPLNDLTFPTGATHFSISACTANLNFLDNVADVVLSNTVNLPIAAMTTTVNLTFDSMPTGTGILVRLLKIEFLQEVNGAKYALKNGAYNALRIIEVI